MKTIKRISLLLAVVLATVCLGIFASACNSATDFTVTVYYSDGITKVDGSGEVKYSFQICYYDEDLQRLGNCCTTDALVGADGEASIKISDVEAEQPDGKIKYEVHIISSNSKPDAEELTETVYLTKNNPTAAVVLKNVQAPAK